MLLYLFLGFLLMVALIGVMVAFTRAEPASLARALRWTAVGLAGAGVLLLPFIGRGSLIAFGPAILLPLITRLVVQRSRQWSSAGPQAGQSSTVETAWLAMTLDHDSGAMAGRVRAGRFAGRPLSELDLPSLLVLLDDCRAADPDAVALLEAYLDRTHGSSWRDPASGAGAGASSGAGPGAPAGGGMTRQEAYEILGLAEGASTQDIKDAHRRLMQNLHPDRGGSTYLAAKINQAKDLLLGN